MLSLVGMLLAFVVPVEGVQTWALLGISGAILAGMVSMPLILGLVANRFGLGQPRVLPLFYAYGISLVSHFLVAVSGHVVISQVAPTTQFIENLVVVPLAQVAVFFPATVGGLGVREAAFVELYSRFGVGAGDAMAGALVFLGLNLASAAVGGLVHVGIGEVKRDG